MDKALSAVDPQEESHPKPKLAKFLVLFIYTVPSVPYIMELPVVIVHFVISLHSRAGENNHEV